MKAVTERKGHWEKIAARKKIINEVLKDEFPGSLWEDAAYLIEAARRLNEEASLWTGPMFYYNQAVNLVQAIREMLWKNTKEAESGKKGSVYKTLWAALYHPHPPRCFSAASGISLGRRASIFTLCEKAQTEFKTFIKSIMADGRETVVGAYNVWCCLASIKPPLTKSQESAF